MGKTRRIFIGMHLLSKNFRFYQKAGCNDEGLINLTYYTKFRMEFKIMFRHLQKSFIWFSAWMLSTLFFSLKK